jgi:hypothetical protein
LNNLNEQIQIAEGAEPEPALVFFLPRGGQSQPLPRTQYTCDHPGYNEIDDCEEEFIYNMTHDEKWHSNDNLENQFLRINGPSVEFSQNYSQNSMMFSNRQDDDSRDYKQEANKCQQLLE